MDLAALQRRLVDFAAARNWAPFHTPKNLAAALSVEASELLEIFQWLTPEQAAAVMEDAGTAHRVRDEVADVLAYLLQFCTALDVDPLVALDAKIDRNELRFPRPDGASVGPPVGPWVGPPVDAPVDAPASGSPDASAGDSSGAAHSDE
nr:nucleotide pyrophosphohydrolase [Streptomyces sp. SID4948]